MGRFPCCRRACGLVDEADRIAEVLHLAHAMGGEVDGRAFIAHIQHALDTQRGGTS
jgi:hypothetical protein